MRSNQIYIMLPECVFEFDVTQWKKLCIYSTCTVKALSIRRFEQCNQQLSNLICQKCDGSIEILLDVGNQQHAVYNSFIQIINFHGLFRNALRCRKTGACRMLVPLR